MVPIRTLIVADDPLIRNSLSRAIMDQENFLVVGATSSRTVVQDISLFQPEIVLWDLGWDAHRLTDKIEGLSGIDQPVVFLIPEGNSSSHLDAPNIRGVLSRSISNERLWAALIAVQQGLVVSEPGLPLPARETRDHGVDLPVENLTQREREVLELMAEGLPNKAIARKLEISDHTVKFHVNAILGKLNAQSRTDAVVRATRLGWINL